MRYLLIVLLFLNGGMAVLAATSPDRPNAKTTPGATNPAITQDTIAKTICNKHGWSTKSERPPAKFTGGLKRQQINAWKYDDKSMRHYEEDHLISLEIGGAPRDPKNLWPEHYSGAYGARTKDKVENKLHELVCSGKLTLKQAQHDISHDWIAAYNKYVADKPKAVFHAVHHHPRPRRHLHHGRKALSHSLAKRSYQGHARCR